MYNLLILLLVQISSIVSLTASFLIMAILLCCSAMISASEVAYFSLSVTNIKELKDSGHHEKLQVIKHLENPKKLLATILISNTFFNLGIIIISNYVTIELIGNHLSAWIYIIQIIVVTLIILFLGEVIPKVYANQNNVKFAVLMAFPLRIIARIVYPISHLLLYSSSIIDKRLEKKKVNAISSNELSHALSITTDDNLSKNDENLLKRIVRFGHIEVTQIMRSRMDIVAVEFETPFDELLEKVLKEGYSRIPTFKKDFDNIVGILYIKDLLPHKDKDNDFKWQTLIRKPYFIPESKKIDDLLIEFQEKKNHLAIVVDEYGGTSGMVTLEDVVEEIVGDITDEADEEITYSEIDPNHFIFEGKTSINDFCKIVNIEDTYFDEFKGDVDSLAGLLLVITGDIPRKDELITYRLFSFKIKLLDQRRIKRVEVTINRN